MSKFHTTVTRRDFMKGLGLAGAGLGAAAATAPVFHDLDELASSSLPHKHAWYAKELDVGTVSGAEMDWSMAKRYDSRTTNYVETGDRKEVDNRAWKKERFPDYQGMSLKGEAVVRAEQIAGRGPSTNWDGSLRDTTMRGPSDYGPDPGYTKWTGTPEEALKMLYSAFRFFGAAQVGVIPLTTNTKKFVAKHISGREHNFVSDSVPSRTDTEIRIPNSYSNILMFTTMEASSEVRHAPASTTSGYNQYYRVLGRVHYFLNSIGWGHLDGGRWTMSNAFAALGGIGEHSRASFVITSYRYGNMLRGVHRIFTNLPLAPTNPINAGVSRFCKTCKTCATLCPYDCMPTGDPDWEPEDSLDTAAGNYIAGFKGWRRYFLTRSCAFCKGCQATCPFNGADTMVHSLVRATQATIPIFNGFMANMHDVFGYGDRDPDTFWEMDMPMGNFDADFVKP